MIKIGNAEFPNIVYKYRDWTNCFHRKMITDLELFYSSPKSFNDPFDFQVTYQYDKLTTEEIEAFYNESPNRETSNRLLFNKEHQIKLIELENETKNNFYGVVSLAAEPDNILMWSHYSNNHTGFCVGFNVEAFKTDNIIGYVDYKSEYPVIIPRLDRDTIRDVLTKMLTKYKLWDYEKEIRLIRGAYSNKVEKLTCEHYNCIILGCKMPIKDKEEIIQIVKTKLPHINIFQCEQHKTEYKINIIKIR